MSPWRVIPTSYTVIPASAGRAMRWTGLPEFLNGGFDKRHFILVSSRGNRAHISATGVLGLNAVAKV